MWRERGFSPRFLEVNSFDEETFSRYLHNNRASFTVMISFEINSSDYDYRTNETLLGYENVGKSKWIIKKFRTTWSHSPSKNLWTATVSTRAAEEVFLAMPTSQSHLKSFVSSQFSASVFSFSFW